MMPAVARCIEITCSRRLFFFLQKKKNKTKKRKIYKRGGGGGGGNSDPVFVHGTCCIRIRHWE